MHTGTETRSDPPRINVLGVGVSATNMAGAVDSLLAASRDGRSGYVCVTGVHGVIESRQDAALRAIHNRSLLTVPDGMPLVWHGRRHGFRAMGRVYGPDLMTAMMEATADGSRSHFLYGTTPDTLAKMVARYRDVYPRLRIAGTYAPPFGPLSPEAERDLRAQVAAERPDFFWVGLSTPKQERFMASYLDMLGPTIMLGVGAAFDLHAGLREDAPDWAKNSGLQWFVRLVQEPRRLWRRYASIVPRFLLLSLLQELRLRSFPIEDHTP